MNVAPRTETPRRTSKRYGWKTFSLYSPTSIVPLRSTALTYARCPNGGDWCGQTATAPAAGVVPTAMPESCATCGQFHAFIAPRMNQSIRCPFACSAHATYEVQLHSYIPQRSTTSATPAAGQCGAYGYP